MKQLDIHNIIQFLEHGHKLDTMFKNPMKWCHDRIKKNGLYVF